MEATGSPVIENSFHFLWQILDETEGALASLQRLRVESLVARSRMLAAMPSFRLSPAEARQLASRCRSLHYLLGYAATNLFILKHLSSPHNVASLDVYRKGYPWQR